MAKKAAMVAQQGHRFVLICYTLAIKFFNNISPYGHLSLKIHSVKFDIIVPQVKLNWKLNVDIQE